jgi:hypothetical protein
MKGSRKRRSRVEADTPQYDSISDSSSAQPAIYTGLIQATSEARRLASGIQVHKVGMDVLRVFL